MAHNVHPGSKGLARRVSDIRESTHGMLHYIGEWHSHPDGSSVSPSRDDLQVLGWLAELMDQDGVPGVLAIVGEGKLNIRLGGQAVSR